MQSTRRTNWLSYWLATVTVLMLLPVAPAGAQFVADAHRDWQQNEPPATHEEVYRVFLVGDIGAVPTDRPGPVLTALRKQLLEPGDSAAIVFLGDNLYCCGLPDSSSSDRPVAEARLRTILTSVNDFPGRIIFVPGNHDWNSSEPGGLEAVGRQERYVESFLDRGDTFLPSDGFPGPARVRLTDDITLLAVDTEWYLTDQEKSFGDDGHNEILERDDLLVALAEQVEDEDDRHLLIVAHHPILSNGTHAGQVPAREHLFPLTALWDNAYVPLPIIGTLSVMYRRYMGVSEQDLAHPRYRALREALLRIFRSHESLVYASGHEHNLQYFTSGNSLHPNHFVVSGSGSKESFVAGGGDAVFTAEGLGYSTIHYYADGSSWVSFWRVEGRNDDPKLVFRRRMFVIEPESEVQELSAHSSPPLEYPDYTDSVAVLAANPEYGAGRLRSFFMGSHNRDAWLEPVRARYLDMGREAGGLVPLKLGGGMQTTSLRLEGADGNEYVLRSLDKDPSRSLPAALRGTVAVDVVRDQITSINPYGAFVIPRLAAATGIYHTQPKLVYVPRDPRLGPYLDTFAERLMMFEDRPDDDVSDVARLGRSKDVESPAKMFSEINSDNDNVVDGRAFLRARLLDMLVADWDRHRDQWRWASFERPQSKGREFRPIPRDRDWAFNRLNGLFPPFIRIIDPKFQDFGESYGNLKGLNASGLEQDRRFTAGLTLDDWLEEARAVQRALTDSVIHAAVGDMPESIVQLKGQEMERTLRIRRDRLDEAASEYYHLIARVIDVVGSDKHERFEVRAGDDGQTEVVVFKTKKDGDIRTEIFRRTFDPSETDEIRLYGLDGHDRFVVEGTGGGLTIRCVGGGGPDTYETSDTVADVVVHDSPGSGFETGRHTSVQASEDPWMNTYVPGEFKHDRARPRLFFGANPDDGLFLGGGALFVNHGYKKSPYSQSHRIVGNVAARTAAFNVVYDGHFVRAVLGQDLHVEAEVRSPNSIRNFYGLGNDTQNTVEDREFYQTRLTQVAASALIGTSNPAGLHLYAGPVLRVTDLRLDVDRFGVQPQPGLSETTFEDQWFAGVRASADLLNLDRSTNPRRGFRWSNEVEFSAGLRNSSSSYGKLRSDLVVIASPSLYPQVTVAARLGGEHTIGSFPFYDAATLGGRENLRGYRSTRFAGRTSFYQNLELRARLFRYSTYLAVGEAGLLGFLDNGRVWTDGETSDTWHPGYGGGLWATFFDVATLGSWIASSPDDLTFTLKLGFQY